MSPWIHVLPVVAPRRFVCPSTVKSIFNRQKDLTGDRILPILSITLLAVSIGIGSFHSLSSSTNDGDTELSNSSSSNQVRYEIGLSVYHRAIKDKLFNSVQRTKCEVDTSSQSQQHRTTTTTTVGTAATATSKSNAKNRLIFLGSGSSTGCPRPLCPLLFSESVDGEDDTVTPELIKLRHSMMDQCRTSVVASIGNPIDNKDYRNNPSLLISIADPTATGSTGNKTDVQQKNIIIDVGKTFREGAIRWLPKHSIRSLDAIILTHQHMDAAAGLDDVRGFQRYEIEPTTSKRYAIPMPLYLSDCCLSSLQDQFPWLLPKPKPINPELQSPDQALVIKRHVASFDVAVFESFKAFEPIPGFSIIPLPLIHGEDLISYGFAFTLGGTMNVVYLSDISRMLPETLDYIQNTLPQPIHVLVLDSLLIDSSNPVHYCLPQSIELIQQLKPIQTYLVGMNCDSFGPHDKRNIQLQKDYGNVQLAYDGLVIDAPSVQASE